MAFYRLHTTCTFLFEFCAR